MKKVFMVMLTLLAITFSVEARGILLRGTHKLCCEEAEMTLYSNGRVLFWNGNYTEEYTYTTQDGYLYLLDSDGNQIYACKYNYHDNTLYWVNVGGKMFRRC